MSIFQNVQTNCPLCKAAVSFELVHSVNAGRRPDLRAAILARSFQRQECPSCGYSFRMAPEFTYLDLPRRQFLAVFPAEKIVHWADYEQRATASFAKAFGPGSGAESLGATLQSRCVFDWSGLNEKLVAAEAGIDDRTLELAKVAVMRNMDTLSFSPDRAFRFVGVDGADLVLGWLRHSTEEIDGELSVPASVLAEIEADAAGWAGVREQVIGPMFVDYQRALITPEPAPAAA